MASKAAAGPAAGAGAGAGAPAFKKLDPAAAIDVANACRAAMKGIGTDEKALITALCGLNPAQAQQVVDAYTNSVRRDLQKDIKSETSGNFYKVLSYGLMLQPELDARLVHTAYKGLGTDEEGLNEIICTRTDAELNDAARAFKKEYEAFMRDEVLGDCSGDYKKLMDAVLTTAEKGGRKLPPLSQVDDDVLRLYKAGEGKIGTNEAVFIEVLATNHRSYVERVAEAYGKKHGKSLVSVIRSEMSGALADGLVALVQPTPEFLADRLHKAMKGAGTNDKVVIRIVMAERDRALRAINEVFLHKYDRSVAHWIKDEFSGDTREALLTVLHSRGL